MFLSPQWLKWWNDSDRIAIAKPDFKLGEAWALVLDAINDVYPRLLHSDLE